MTWRKIGSDRGGVRKQGGRSPGGPRRPEPLSSALSGYLNKTGISEAIQRLTAVDDWPRVVGPRISRVTRALEVRGEALVVEVTSSAWLNELAMMKAEILARMNEASKRPPIERIILRLAESPVEHELDVAGDSVQTGTPPSTPTKRA